MQHPDTQALLSAICDMQELTGYNPSNISRIINGKYAASIDIIGKIAHALGRRIDFIDEGDE